MSASIYYNWVVVFLLLFLVACAPGGSPTPSAIPTVSPSATGTPTPEPTVTPTVAPTATDPPTPTPTPSPTPLSLLTATHTPIPLVIIGPPAQTATHTPMSTGIRPELLGPLQGREYQNPITFEWNGSLGTGQAYQVTAYHLESGHTLHSELLTTRQWAIDLPPEQYGEWRFEVAVLGYEDIVAISSEGMFWFNPFPGVGVSKPGSTPTPCPCEVTPP